MRGWGEEVRVGKESESGDGGDNRGGRRTTCGFEKQNSLTTLFCPWKTHDVCTALVEHLDQSQCVLQIQ